ncbi:hypothetical protein L1049_023559 [Liquidambar formosana]|uniref:Uncharacterized protein n=1 Tax=Liquidambar formosana TaxID=63359 RepID=A0AAP0RT18_LIQFO
MQASRQYRSSGMSKRLYYQPVQGVETFCLPQFQTLDHQLCYDDSNQGTHFSIQTSRGRKYCTLESSSGTGSYKVYDSPSTVSFSPNGSPLSQQESSYPPDLHHSPDNTYGSPMSVSCITEDLNDLRHKLRELESVMLGPDS